MLNPPMIALVTALVSALASALVLATVGPRTEER